VKFFSLAWGPPVVEALLFVVVAVGALALFISTE
jgi:hypothetical protein